MRFFKGMSKLLIPINLPLFLAVGRQQPALMATAAALAVFLGKMTINGSGPASNVSSFDTALEQSAIASLVTTSTLNRVVRISMGSCHLLGAVLYNVRTSRVSLDRDAIKEASSSMTAATVWQGTVEWVLTLALCVVAGLWLSSGYYGQ